MQERIIKKTFRMTPEEELKLKEMSYKSGLSESAVIRACLEGSILKENTSKDFWIELRKLNDTADIMKKVMEKSLEDGEIYYNDIKIYYTQLKKFIDEARKKYL